MMKKVFTLLTLALLSIGSAWADPTPGEANSTYLDISKYATITTAGFSTGNNSSAISYFNEETEWLTVCAYVANNSRTQQKWVTSSGSPGADNSKGGWSATNVFKGYTSYFSDGYRNLCVQSEKTVSFKVTGCDEVRALVNARSGKSGAAVSLAIYEINADGSRKSETPVKTSTTNTTNSATVISTTGLEGSKIYEAYVYAGTANNEFLYEIAFKKADSRTATSLNYSAATASVNLGDTFDAPTLTKSPVALEGVTYTSSNKAVATIDANGAVTIVAGGVTTITASFAGNETYKPSSASYLLTVTDTSNPSYTDETFKATWAFSTGAAGQTAVYTYGTASEELMKNNNVSLGANLSYNGTQALTESGSSIGENSTKISQGAAGSATETKNAIKFTITPKLGITFTPTKVKFRATRCGTDGGAMAMSWIDTEHDAVSLGTASASKTGAGATDPARDNNATKNYTVYEYDLTAKGAVATTGECGLQIITHSANGKSYAFSQIEIEGKLNGALSAVMTYTINASAGVGGSVSPTSSVVNEGDDLSIGATADTGYEFINWTKASDGDWSSTTNPLAISDISADETYTANFKKLFTVSFNVSAVKGEIDASKILSTYDAANSINEKYANKSDKFTIPAYADKYLFLTGYVFNKWSDGEGNEYDSGETITLTKDVTLTPVWRPTTQTLAKSSAETAVTWAFAKPNIVFVDWQSSSYGYYTQTATINGEKIAVPIKIVNGKVANYTRTDALAQTNKETKFTIPAITGMTVVINSYGAFLKEDSGDKYATTFAGENLTDVNLSNEGKTATYTYNGTDETIDIVLGNDAQYISTIAVTYPAMTVAANITSAEYATFVPSAKVSVPSGVKAYIVTATSATTATLSSDDAITVIDANKPVIINGSEGTYYFPKTTADASDVTGNKLTTGAVTADGTQYILANGGSGVGFYKATPDTEIAAGKAYLVSPSGAPCLLFNFFDDMQTTGVNDVRSKMADVRGDFFDLQGRKVANPTKGLYIVNGKKAIVK